jgi:hypothetical protein
MTLPPIRSLRRIAIAIAIAVTTGVLLWAVWWLWSLLSPQWDSRTITAITITALAFVAGIWWLWWRLPKRQVRSLDIQIPKDCADTEDNFRKTVGQALGGAAVLIGALAAYVQFTQQQQASDQQSLRQQQAAQDLLVSNQISKGFEQLASDKLTMRLGGISPPVIRVVVARRGATGAEQVRARKRLVNLLLFVCARR